MAIARSKLEANDIQCFSRDELTVQVHNFYSNAVGGVKLEVMEQDVERALAILKEETDLHADYSDTAIRCSNCGSGNIAGVKFKGKLSLVLMFLFGLPMAIKSSKYYCFDCQGEYPLAKANRADT